MEPVDPELTDRLTSRLTAAVGDVEATPDLDGVLVGAGRHRRRQRNLGIGAAAVVVALGVGGVVLVANRDVDDGPSAQPEPAEVPATEAPAETTAADEELQPATTYLLGEGEDSFVDVIGPSAQYDPNAPDPAEPYLAQTTEIYRRETPSGVDVQVRRSAVSYGELFDIDWDLPIGSQEACLGGAAVFIGSPDGPPQWVSTWTVRQWGPLDSAQEIAIDEYYTETSSNLIVRTSLPAQSVSLTQGSATLDAAEFANGVAVVEFTYRDGEVAQELGDETGPMLAVSVDGESEPRTFPVYGEYFGSQAVRPGCAPPPFPGQQLPEPGVEQPADIAAAEQAVRERHALLVDRSDAEKPADLLTDDTGVAEARAQMEAGPYAESAAGAEYTIDGVVFTDATNAWFEYTIVAPTGTFGPRFGQAQFNGEVWQITRQTICQDLSLASGYCDPGGGTPTLEPPLADGVDRDQALAEWERLQNDFYLTMECNPLNPCGDFDVRTQLPEVGEPPADRQESEVEIATLMQSIYGAGKLADGLDVLDDATGVAEALEQIAAGGFGDDAAASTAQIDELVFTSPTTASFRYTLAVSTLGIAYDRIGGAVRIDGDWRILRTTVCTDLALAGGDCDA